MSDIKHDQGDATLHLMKTEAVLDILEAAIESELDVDAVTELPDGLKDPNRVMERGRALLTEGLRFHTADLSSDLVYDDEFRIAARNGNAIPDHIRTRMHSERAAAEAQIAMEFDESR